jgi:predicted Zn-ribbon and HTH transcriptional regulator
VSIRCRNCGYDNPDENAACSKCNQPLIAGRERHVPLSSYADEENFNPRETVRETNIFTEEASQPAPVNTSTCSKCGYPLLQSVPNCPNCKQLIQDNSDSPKEDIQFGRRTVRPGKRNRCELTLIHEENEKIEPVTLSFSGEEIILNRNNTEPDNMTITSKEQAALICENKRWYIEDRSELKTTYVRVGERFELQPGDIIMLGDRCFKFDF